MNMQLKKRLDNLETRIAPTEQRIIVLQQKGESREDMNTRVERWKAGDEVPGILTEEPYKGGKLSAFFVCFVLEGYAGDLKS